MSDEPGVEPTSETHADPAAEAAEQASGRRALAARVAATKARAQAAAERAQAERERHNSLDAAFEIVDRDAEIGGSIMAGALAYRLFIWLLPLALVAVAGLGIAASAASRSPEGAAKSAGLAGLVSSSVAGAANSSARWYAVLIGIPILLYATRSVLRTLIVTHRLVWGESRGNVAKPTVKATLVFLLALLGYFVSSGLANAARQASGLGGLVALLLIPIPFAALWLVISRRLPHSDAGWKALLPGAALFGVGIEVLHVVTEYFLAPQASSKQGTYGSLGLAALLLLGLFLISRLMIGTAVLNATLWTRHKRSLESTAGPAGTSEAPDATP